MHRFTVLLLTFALAGCPTSMSADPDVGLDAEGGLDSGTDASEAVDTGIDAPSTPDAGSDAGAVMGMDGSILPPYDASDPFGDTGTAGPPAWVEIDVLTDGSTCPALTACGGDEVGTWDVTGGCIELPVGMELDRCPGATLSAVGRARGRVTFTGTVADRVAQSEITASVFVPTLCASFIGGCDAIEGLIAMQIPDVACVTAPAGCNCEGRVVNTIDDADGYVIEGNEIVSATLMKRWEYCVDGDAMRYRDVSGSGTLEPGIIDLGR